MSRITSPHEPPASEQPESIGRYRVEKALGQGGFGIVYLAHDPQLDRPVAIKVPHPNLVSGPKDAEAYLKEARTVAGLDHPNSRPWRQRGTARTRIQASTRPWSGCSEPACKTPG